MALVDGANYQATIPATDLTENGTLAVFATCGFTTTAITIGYVNLYDPSGTIADARTGDPIVSATVTLYHVPGWEPKTSPNDNRPNTCESNASKETGIPWSQPAPTHLGVIVNPEITTVDPALTHQATNLDGYYGWDVSAGCWYVTVEAEGYEPLVSPVVGVPPEVTDLDLALTPTAAPFAAVITKAVTPTGQVNYGDTLTYTLVISAVAGVDLVVYDPLTQTTFLRFVTQPTGVIHSSGAITGTVEITPTTQLTLSFVTQVGVPGTVGWNIDVSNRACVYPAGGTVAECIWSNTITNTAFRPHSIFLPLVTRN